MLPSDGNVADEPTMHFASQSGWLKADRDTYGLRRIAPMALSQILVALALSSAAALTRSPMRMSATATPTHVTTKSDAIMAEAKTVMPGGVSSPVRAFKSVGGDPIVFDSVKGAYAFDVDGNQRGARVHSIARRPPPRFRRRPTRATFSAPGTWTTWGPGGRPSAATRTTR